MNRPLIRLFLAVTAIAAAAADLGGSTFRIDSLEPDVVPGGSRGSGERRRPRAAQPAAGPPHAEVILRDGDLVAKRGDGSEKPLTSGATKDFHFTEERLISPDGRWMIAPKLREGEHRAVTIVESTPKDQPQPRVIEFRYDKPGDRIDERFPHLFDLDTLAEVPLDESLFATPWEISDFLWLPDSSSFLFRYNERGHRVMRIVNIDVPTGRVSGGRRRAEQHIHRLGQPGLTPLSPRRGNAPLEKRAERFVAKGRDGITNIHGIILGPSDFDPARSYPVIENVYAGPQDSHVPVAWRPSFGSMSQLAELGFVVVQADGMGTAKRTRRFTTSATRISATPASPTGSPGSARRRQRGLGSISRASVSTAAAALVKAGKDFELLVMPATGHGAAETPYASRRRAEFLFRQLGSPTAP